MKTNRKAMCGMLFFCWVTANIQVLAHGATPMGAVIFCSIESILCIGALYAILKL